MILSHWYLSTGGSRPGKPSRAGRYQPVLSIQESDHVTNTAWQDPAPRAAAKTRATGTWSADGLQPRQFEKVLVLARISEDAARRILEDTIVKGLTDKGVTAVQAYKVLAPADLASAEAIRSKAQELGVDAGIVISVTGEDTKVESGPSVRAHVGVPARVGPFSMFLGTSVPLGGGPSVVKKTTLTAKLYDSPEGDPVWIGNYMSDLKAGPEKEARQLGGLVSKQLIEAGFFMKP